MYVYNVYAYLSIIYIYVYTYHIYIYTYIEYVVPHHGIVDRWPSSSMGESYPTFDHGTCQAADGWSPGHRRSPASCPSLLHSRKGVTRPVDVGLEQLLPLK